MEAMIRLAKNESCYWAKGAGEGLRRRFISIRNRHLAMLRLNSKYGKSLLPQHHLVHVAREALERVLSGSPKDVAGEVVLIEILVGYSAISGIVVSLRDAAAMRLMESLESPIEFRNTLSLLTEIDIQASLKSEEAEGELRDRFWDFAEKWDREEALRVNDVPACEEAISTSARRCGNFLSMACWVRRNWRSGLFSCRRSSPKIRKLKRIKITTHPPSFLWETKGVLRLFKVTSRMTR